MTTSVCGFVKFVVFAQSPERPEKVMNSTDAKNHLNIEFTDSIKQR
ncbi:MAG TPA: hypothetical protein VKN14_12795 [Flavobacteriaceae bacterium]|nr:hypothetical protein [Flavobacteriaceae bacterium]